MHPDTTSLMEEGKDNQQSFSTVEPSEPVVGSSNATTAPPRSSQPKWKRKRDPPSHSQVDSNDVSKRAKSRSSSSASSPLLSVDQTRHCMYEWFYSSVDRPYFHDASAFRDACLTQRSIHGPLTVPNGHDRGLCRTEWTALRSSKLGPLRRFSRAFLLDERRKLAIYRSSIRSIFSGRSTPRAFYFGHDVPVVLPVHAAVLAIHPLSQELHTGSIVAQNVDQIMTSYDVLFDDLGLETCPDTNVMPLDASCFVKQRVVDPTAIGRVDPIAEDSSPVVPSSSHVSTEPKLIELDEETLAKAKLYASIQRLLLRKKKCIEALRHLLSSSSGSGSDTADRPIASDYAWILVNLDLTNKALDPAMVEMRKLLQTEEEEEGVEEGEENHPTTIPPLPSFPFPLSLQTTTTNNNNNNNMNDRELNWAAHNIKFGRARSERMFWNDYQRLTQSQYSSLISSREMELILACLTTLVVIKQCGEQSLVPEMISVILDTLVKEMKPTFRSNDALFGEIQALVQYLKTVLVHG